MLTGNAIMPLTNRKHNITSGRNQANMCKSACVYECVSATESFDKAQCGIWNFVHKYTIYQNVKNDKTKERERDTEKNEH